MDTAQGCDLTDGYCSSSELGKGGQAFCTKQTDNKPHRLHHHQTVDQDPNAATCMLARVAQMRDEQHLLMR